LNPLKRQFIELAKLSGWSQAEIGRKLDLSRGGVNGIITGEENPSMALVRLFQFVLNSEQPQLFGGAASIKEGRLPKPKLPDPAASRFDDLIAKLAELEEDERDELLEMFKQHASLLIRAGKIKKY
jgi:transcriptional regulator with XRE-family HTH domain